jgi:hypothetical protein
MLKRWESPRKEGRNDKGKGGSARRRQLKKQTQMLRKQLKSKGQISDQGGRPAKSNEFKKKESHAALLFLDLCSRPATRNYFCVAHYNQVEFDILATVSKSLML